jgi:RNA polymerase sigma-70 factor (ECF subfamily)
LDVDPDLVQAAAKGDEIAFEEIVRLTHADMYGLAFRLLGNEDDARDVVQEVYLRMYKSLRKFRGDSAFSTWLYRIVANASYTFLRRRTRHRAESLELVEEPEATTPRPEDVSDNRALREQLKRHLLALPPDQRVVVVMKDVYDLPHDAIAEELGISVTAAKVRLHRARKKLRAAIETRGALDAVS